MVKNFDLVIIGRGSAAFSAAIKASEITMHQAKIAMIGYGYLGGTCVNVGCVPSKYLIEAAKVAQNQRYPKYPGIKSIEPSIDFKKLMNSLREVVNNERENKYINVLKSYENIEVFDGKSSFISNDTVKIDSGEEMSGYNFIIATGSKTKIPDINGLRETGYLTSDTVWSLNYMPESLGIIGGGFAGLELGQAFQRLGSHVAIIKEHETIVKGIENELGNELIKALGEEGIQFLLKRKVKKVYKKGNKKIIETLHGNETEKIEVDEILMTSGRTPNIDNLGLEKAGIKYSEEGITVNDKLQTSNPLIYAAGDVVHRKYKLETLAAREGATIASNLYENGSKKINLQEIPISIFTEPQLASVGYTEKEYNEKFGKSMSRTIPLNFVPKARLLRENCGMFKIVIDEKTEKIVGVHVLSPYAAEFIIEGVNAIKNNLTYLDIINSTHIFPTVAEGIKLTAQSFYRNVSKMSCCME